MVTRDIRDLARATAYDANGDKLGSVREVYINDATGQPDFVEVNHGLFGMTSSLVPLRGHRFEGNELRLAFAKDLIEESPKVDDDSHLSDEQQEKFYRHYGLEGTENIHTYEGDRRPVDHDPPIGRDTGEGHSRGGSSDRRSVDDWSDVADQPDRSGQETGEGREADARPDDVGSPARPGSGRVRLRRYIIEETETVEVPVRREEVRTELIPVDDDDAEDVGRGGERGWEEDSGDTVPRR